MNKDSIYKVIALLEGAIARRSDVTCTQFLTVMYALVSGGMTQKQLADTLDITEGAVSRNIQKLGPEGSGCLCKDGRFVQANSQVSDLILEVLQSEPFVKNS